MTRISRRPLGLLVLTSGVIGVLGSRDTAVLGAISRMEHLGAQAQDKLGAKSHADYDSNLAGIDGDESWRDVALAGSYRSLQDALVTGQWQPLNGYADASFDSLNEGGPTGTQGDLVARMVEMEKRPWPARDFVRIFGSPVGNQIPAGSRHFTVGIQTVAGRAGIYNGVPSKLPRVSRNTIEVKHNLGWIGVQHEEDFVTALQAGLSDAVFGADDAMIVMDDAMGDTCDRIWWHGDEELGIYGVIRNPYLPKRSDLTTNYETGTGHTVAERVRRHAHYAMSLAKGVKENAPDTVAIGFKLASAMGRALSTATGNTASIISWLRDHVFKIEGNEDSSYDIKKIYVTHELDNIDDDETISGMLFFNSKTGPKAVLPFAPSRVGNAANGIITNIYELAQVGEPMLKRPGSCLLVRCRVNA